MTETAQRWQTAGTAGKAQPLSLREGTSAEDERMQSQTLICELLIENQNLRFRVAQLDYWTPSEERGPPTTGLVIASGTNSASVGPGN